MNIENHLKPIEDASHKHLQPPLGLYEKALPSSLPWKDKLAVAKQAGFDFIEISIDESDERISLLNLSCSQRLDLACAARELEMPFKSLSLSAHRRFPLGSPDQSIRYIGLKLLEQAIEFSLDVGIRTILLAGCDVYYQKSTLKTQDQFLQSLETAVRWAEQSQIMLALENWDKPIDSLSEVMRYVNTFQSPWFQAYADIGNLAYAEKNILDELEAARGHIAALHVKDTLPGELRFVSPGEGVVPFQAVFRKLTEMNYHGAMVLELWTGDLPDALGKVASACWWIRSELGAAVEQQTITTLKE